MWPCLQAAHTIISYFFKVIKKASFVGGGQDSTVGRPWRGLLTDIEYNSPAIQYRQVFKIKKNTSLKLFEN